MSIGRAAFEKCESLEKMTMPVMLKDIGEYSFMDCTNLSELYVQKKVASIGRDVFANDESLEVFAPKYSEAATLLIDKDINMAFSDLRRAQEADDVADWTITSYDMSDTGVSGYVPLVLKYAVKEKYKDSLSDLKLVLGAAPVSCIAGIKLDGIQISFEAGRDGRVVVPLEKTSGSVTVHMLPNDYGKVASYARLEYKTGGKEGNALLGAVSERASSLSLAAADKVSYEKGASSLNYVVNGYAGRQKEVDLYLDDRFAGTITASANGVYQAEITLDRPADYKAYRVKAVSENRSGKEISVEKKYIPFWKPRC